MDAKEHIDPTSNSRLNHHFAYLAIVFLRYLIGCTLIYAGMGKLANMDVLAALPEYEGNHPTLKLMRAMSDHYYFWLFTGMVQLLGGALLVTQRMALLGALIAFGVVLNMLVVVLPYEFGATPIVNLFLLICILALLAWDFRKLKVIVFPASGESTFAISPHKYYHHYWSYAGIVFLFHATLFGALEQYLVIWMGSSLLLGIVVWGIYFFRIYKK